MCGLLVILEEPAAVEEEESAVVFGKDASCVKCMAREDPAC